MVEAQPERTAEASIGGGKTDGVPVSSTLRAAGTPQAAWAEASKEARVWAGKLRPEFLGNTVRIHAGAGTLAILKGGKQDKAVEQKLRELERKLRLTEDNTVRHE